MSIFPKVALRLEVENYLKEGFTNKEVGQKNMRKWYLQTFRYLHTLEKNKSKRKQCVYSFCFLLSFRV